MPDAEVDAGEDAGDSAGGEFFVAVDGVEEGVGVAGVDEDVAHVGHVGVGGVGWGTWEASVLVFNLRDDDGAAATDLEWAVSWARRLIHRSAGTMKAGSLERRTVDMAGL